MGSANNVVNARDLYERYRGAMAYVVVENSDGDENIGSAFHVGEGVFVTARHVVEGRKIVEIATSTRTHIRLDGEAAEKSLLTINTGDEQYKAHSVEPSALTVEFGPYFHPDPGIDVAIFRVGDIDPYTPAVPLGDHLDDWLGQDDYVLTEVVVLGYPPLPFTRGPYLFAARGEVNALADLRHAKHVHFIVSTMPRGGFSGGVVLTQAGVALGVVTESLLSDNQPVQLGYMSVLTVEPIYTCLAANRLMPRFQAEPWNDFWNLESTIFVEKSPDGFGEIAIAFVESCDDGPQLYLEVRNLKSEPDRDRAVQSALTTLEKFETTVTSADRGGIRIAIANKDGGREALTRACTAASTTFDDAGYMQSRRY